MDIGRRQEKLLLRNGPSMGERLRKSHTKGIRSSEMAREL